MFRHLWLVLFHFLLTDVLLVLWLINVFILWSCWFVGAGWRFKVHAEVICACWLTFHEYTLDLSDGKLNCLVKHFLTHYLFRKCVYNNIWLGVIIQLLQLLLIYFEQ